MRLASSELLSVPTLRLGMLSCRLGIDWSLDESFSSRSGSLLGECGIGVYGSESSRECIESSPSSETDAITTAVGIGASSMSSGPLKRMYEQTDINTGYDMVYSPENNQLLFPWFLVVSRQGSSRDLRWSTSWSPIPAGSSSSSCCCVCIDGTCQLLGCKFPRPLSWRHIRCGDTPAKH
jgi:hypothetical protein